MQQLLSLVSRRWLCACLILLSAGSLQAITITYQVDQCGNGNDFQVTFTLTDLPGLNNQDKFYADIPARYSILWSYGDETYAEEIITLEEYQGMQNKVVSKHTYYDVPTGTSTFATRVEVTSVYQPPGDIDAVSSSTVADSKDVNLTNAGNLNNCESFQTDESDYHLPGRETFANDAGWVKTIRNVVPGDLFTIAIELNKGLCGDFPITDTLGIRFHSSQLSPVWSSSSWNDVQTNGPYDKEYNLPALLRAQSVEAPRFILFTFQVKNLNIGDEVELEVYRTVDLGQTCSGKPEDQIVTVKAEAKGTHDPNDKTVSPKVFYSPLPQELTYTISFYNGGMSPLNKATIKDILDPRLDPTTVKDVVAWIGNNPPIDIPETPNSRVQGENHVIWDMQNALLPNGLSGTKGKVPSRDKWVNLSFKVNTLANLPDVTCIPNEAEITFLGTEGTTYSTKSVSTCRMCCERIATKGQTLTFALRSTQAGTIIELKGKPDFFKMTGKIEGTFTRDDFDTRTLYYREVTPDRETGDSIRGPVQSLLICGTQSTLPTCGTVPPCPPCPPPPKDISLAILLTLLLLIALLSILLGICYLRNRSVMP